MSRYFVYVLRSLKDGLRYVGMTGNVQKRFDEHNSGQTNSSRKRRPFVLEYFEEFEDRAQARSREKYYKTAAGRRFLDKLDKGKQITDKDSLAP